MPSPKPKKSEKPQPSDRPKPSSAPPKAAAEAVPTGGYFTTGSVTYVRRAKPTYPPEALRKKQTGTVMLMVYVNETGSVDQVEIVVSSGIPSLDAAALTAEKRSHFQPFLKNGAPSKFKAKVPYRFQIQ